ncbi:hypothetical protein [Promineifilum sp.]|uniref:hypothetical protein n=1 Tax=Promineifilum sp. TaxID=2664178 RepID=UPI0035B0F4F9
MQEVTVNTPKGKGEQVARLALEIGIAEASVSSAYTYGPDREQDVVSIEVSAPEAAEFIQKVMSAPFYNPADFTIVADEVMAVISSEPPELVTRPMKISSTSILQDLWMQNHVNAAYLGRAIVSSLLVAYGLMEADMTILIIALLFTPFLTQDLAVAFGGWMRDWQLARRGALIMGLSTLIAILAGVLVAVAMDGPMKYDQFGTLQSNFIISLLVGVVAGLDTADEAGRREFIAVAGAAQFTSFPVWFGIALIQGFPDGQTTAWRIATFFVNIATILVAALATYIALRCQPDIIARYLRSARSQN